MGFLHGWTGFPETQAIATKRILEYIVFTEYPEVNLNSQLGNF